MARKEVINVWQRFGAKEILESLENGMKRYSELYELKKNGERIFDSSTTLSNRLRELIKFGLINRNVANNPDGVSWKYELTNDGKKVLYHIRQIEMILSKKNNQ